MFYCKECGIKNDWPVTLSVSFGRCEICKKETQCNDRPSKYLLPKKEKMRIFLGGSCTSNWRERLIPMLEVEDIDYFNPLVKSWNEEARLNEEREKKICTHHIYMIVPPVHGVYSIAETFVSHFNKPGSVIFGVLDEGEGFPRKMKHSLEATLKLASENNIPTVQSLDELVDVLVIINDKR